MIEKRLAFELDDKIDETLATAHAGIPWMAELFRACGAAEVMERRASPKQRQRGLRACEMAESLFALWLSGGERSEDMDRLREDRALAVLLGHELPAARTARSFLVAFHAEDLPLLQAGERAVVPSESELLEGLAAVSGQVVRYLQQQQPATQATLDVDATILESDKQAAKATDDGRRGYQPVFVVWAEQDVMVADEFRDGNVPAGSGNLRVVQKAVEALPPGVEQIRVRGDSALYEHALLDWMAGRGIGFAVSADMSRELHRLITALPETAWRMDREESGAVRQWAEVAFVSDEQLQSALRAEAAHVTRRFALRPAQASALFALQHRRPRRPPCPRNPASLHFGPRASTFRRGKGHFAATSPTLTGGMKGTPRDSVGADFALTLSFRVTQEMRMHR